MNLTESKALLARSRKVIPDATHTYSKGPFMFPTEGVPFAVHSARGALVTDVDGNDYIDWTAALCAMSLGHDYPTVRDAVYKQMRRGTVYGLPHYLETECAERFTTMTGYDMVRFGKNGSDVTSAAVRLARAVTGRDMVWKIRGHYHGCADWAQSHNPRCKGVPFNVGRDVFELDPGFSPYREYGDPLPACIILEPVQTAPPPDGYLEALREWCTEHGALLIFDEVITGFRCAVGGWAEVSGVKPDLACFGKAIGNGYPISALAGKREYMEQLGSAFMSYTFGGETLSLAACQAVMAKYYGGSVPACLEVPGAILKRWLEAGSSRLEGMIVTGFPWRIVVRFMDDEGNDDLVAKSVFLQQCFANGIMTNGQFIPMLAHQPEDVEKTLDGLGRVFDAMAGVAPYYGQLLVGEPIRGAGVR